MQITLIFLTVLTPNEWNLLAIWLSFNSLNSQVQLVCLFDLCSLQTNNASPTFLLNYLFFANPSGDFSLVLSQFDSFCVSCWLSDKFRNDILSMFHEQDDWM